MVTISVTNAAELARALQGATGGETIALAAGDYGWLGMGENFRIPARYASEVRIVSADPDAPASLTGFLLRGASNVTFENMVFKYDFDGTPPNVARPFKISDGENITIRNSLFEGDVASGRGPADDGHGTGFGLSVSGRGLTIEGNEFTTWYKAMALTGQDIVVRGNDIHSVRSDGINAVRVTDILIEDNHFHDFAASQDSGDHRDMIQFWTTNTSRPSTGITIRDNRLDMGEGASTQSIFMRNEEVDRGRAGEEMFYRDVLIEGNVITNGHVHGITVGETAGLTIRANTVIQDAGAGGRAVDVPKINVAGASTDVAITGNIAGGLPGAKPGWDVDGNLRVQNTDPGAPGHYGDVFIDSSLGTEAGPALRPGGPAEAIGAGAPASAARDPNQAAFTIHDGAGDPLARVFDAALGRGPAELAGLRFEWRFEDGSVATGPVVTKTFAEAGTHGATLRVTGPAGASEAQASVGVSAPRLAALGPDGVALFEAGAARYEEIKRPAEGGGIDLEPKGVSAWLSGREIDRVYAAETIELGLTLAPDAPGAGTTGLVLHLLGAIRMRVGSDGALGVEIFTDGGKVSLASQKGLFSDAGAHEVLLRYDGPGAAAALMIDGRVAAEAALPGQIGPANNQSLVFGDAWGKTNFDGTVTAFGIAIGEPAHDPYAGEIAPVPAGAPGAPPLTVPPPPPPGDGGDAEGGDAEGEERGDAGGGDGGDGNGDGHEDGAPVQAAPWTPHVGAPTFDLAAAALGEGISTYGSAALAKGPDGAALVFDGARGFASLGDLGRPARDGRLSVDVSFERDGAQDGAERLVWNNGLFGLELGQDGLTVLARTAGGGTQRFWAEAEGLSEAGAHRVAVAIDSAADRIQIVVDGRVVRDDAGAGAGAAGPGADIDLAGGQSRDWWVGTPWNRWFDGEVGALTIDDDARFHEGGVGAVVDDALLLG